MVTHSVTMLEKHLVYAGETPCRNFTTNRVKKRTIKPEDPMSHRIIEKRRRDRMNNCLADLSRLIPPEYLKKGRGRIEKTEIIEMAIKHMRHLQNLIASSRFNENSDNSVPSPPATSLISREPTTITCDQPIIVEHYRLGYLECLSEAMHFLVEVQGYFAGDSLCVQMINHLHKHCDKILKGNTLNFPKKHAGETASSDSSTSPTNVVFNHSPPLGMSNSTGSASDDNQTNQNFESGRQYENASRVSGHRSPRRCSESSYSKKSSESCYPRYAEPEGVDGENRSDSELHQSYGLKCGNKDDSKNYLNNFETAVNFGSRNYSTQGNYPNIDNSGSIENVSLREENGNGPSQLREMLMSPSSQMNGHTKAVTETKGNASPVSNNSGCESTSGNPHAKLKPSKDAGDGDFADGTTDNHHSMYKFKNNIKQRFSKEKRENPEFDGDAPAKKPKPNDEYIKFSDPLMRERLNLLDREIEEEKVFKFNADFETKKRIRYASESDTHDGDISNRLSFGHKASEKGRRWEEAAAFSYQSNPKLWSLSPNGSVPYLNSQPSMGCKVPGRHIAEYSSAISNSFNGLSISAAESGQGVPIFALHAKGSFYIPLTLDHATLAPFLTVLGVTKTDEAGDEKTVLHPVTISVNFQPHFVR